MFLLGIGVNFKWKTGHYSAKKNTRSSDLFTLNEFHLLQMLTMLFSNLFTFIVFFSVLFGFIQNLTIPEICVKYFLQNGIHATDMWDVFKENTSFHAVNIEYVATAIVNVAAGVVLFIIIITF